MVEAMARPKKFCPQAKGCECGVKADPTITLLPPDTIFRNLPAPKLFWDSQITRFACFCRAHRTNSEPKQGAQIHVAT